MMQTKISHTHLSNLTVMSLPIAEPRLSLTKVVTILTRVSDNLGCGCGPLVPKKEENPVKCFLLVVGEST